MTSGLATVRRQAAINRRVMQATAADLRQRAASQFYVLVSTASLRQLVKGKVPRGVIAQAEELLRFAADSDAAEENGGSS